MLLPGFVILLALTSAYGAAVHRAPSVASPRVAPAREPAGSSWWLDLDSQDPVPTPSDPSQDRPAGEVQEPVQDVPQGPDQRVQKGPVGTGQEPTQWFQGPAVTLQAPPDSIEDRLTVYGDFRLRLEDSFRLDGKEDRYRTRIRARLGANYFVNEEVLLGARLVTGDPDDPRSSHVTLGDELSNFEVSLDRAFLTYRPEWWAGSFGTVGKFSSPLYRNPVYGELVWDDDVQPEGAIVGYQGEGKGWFHHPAVMLGVYTLVEQSNADDSYSIVGQLQGTADVTERSDATLAVKYFYYDDTTPDSSEDLVEDNAGNGVVDLDGDGAPDDYVSDFGILNTVLAWEYTGWDTPLVVSGEYIKNLLADTDEDTGWGLGLALGSWRKQGDWRFYYQYIKVEEDAVFSPFAQDDLLFTTNHRSHLLGVNYQFTDVIGLHLWTLVSRIDEPGNDPTNDSTAEQWRLRLDLNIRF